MRVQCNVCVQCGVMCVWYDVCVQCGVMCVWYDVCVQCGVMCVDLHCQGRVKDGQMMGSLKCGGVV